MTYGILLNISTVELGLLVFAAILGATGLGVVVGRRVKHLSESLSESFGILQGALLGLVGLILAFGLSLALARYEDRRTAIVEEANAIGTTYLRAQTLAEPARTDSIKLLETYTDSAIRISVYAPSSPEEATATATENALQRRLWRLAGQELDARPQAGAPRLYVETLNEMIDAQTSRTAALNNDVPAAVWFLELFGAAVALGLLAAYLTLLGRGLVGVLFASLLIAFLLFVISDLDRPTKGLIEVPDNVLVELRESMDLPPAARGPRAPDR